MAGLKHRLAAGSCLLALACASSILAQTPAPAPAAARNASPGEAEWAELKRRGEEAFAAGNHDEAESLTRQALALAETLFPADHPNIWMTTANMGAAHYVRGRYAEALALFERSTDGLLRTLGPDHDETISAAGNLARAYVRLNRSADAEPLFRQALASRERLSGPDHGSTLELVFDLANLLLEQGRFADAEPLFARGAEAARRTLGETHQTTIGWNGWLERAREEMRIAAANPREAEYRAVARRMMEAGRRGDVEQAVDLARQTLAAAEAAFGPDHEAVMLAANDVGVTLINRGRYGEAEPFLRRALEGRERLLGPDAPATLVSVATLGHLYSAQSRLAEAEPLYRRALDARRRTLGAEHADTLDAQAALASLHMAQARFAEGLPELRQILAIRRRLLGDSDPATLRSMNQLAEGLLLAGRNREAEPLLREVVAAREAALGADHVATLVALNSLGQALEEMGRLADAESLYRRVLEARRRTLGPDHPESLTSLNNLGSILEQQGRAAEAEPLLFEAMNATERALGPNHLMTRTSLANVAFLYVGQGRNAEAEALYLRAIESAESASGRDHPDTLTYLSMLARLYQRTGRHSEADPLLQRVYEVRLRTLGPAHASTIGALNNLATAAAVAGRVDEAAAMTERALAAAEAELGPEHPSTLSLTSNLAYLYERIGRRAEAIPLLRRALDTRERVLGRDHPDTLLSATNFGIGLIEQGRPAEGEAYLVRVLEAHERTSGPDHPDTADAAANLAAMRLYRPEVGRSALAPARRVAEIVRASRRAGASVRGGEAEEDRIGLARAEDLSLLADAAWVAAETGEIARPPALALAFPALQESMPGQADRAVARMAVRRYADETRSGLGALVRERDDLADRWAASRADLSAALAGDGPEAEELRARLRDERSRIDARLTEIDSILARDFPQYAALARPEPLDLAAAQAMLAPDEAMIVVVPTLFGTQIVALSRDGSSWARSAWKRGEIDSAVRRLLWDVGGNVQVDPALSAEWTAQGGAGYPFDRTTAFNLYREIVAPVAATLAGKRHVFIAAAGSLSSLPFGMLVAAPPEGADGDPAALRSTRWFADAHALIQIPSVQSLQFLRRFARSGAEGSAGAFVGFGDPALLGQAQARGRNRGATLTNLRQIRYMSRLPGTAVELEAMRAALGAPPQSVFLAERATESALRSADLSGTRILALATHGLMAGEISGAAEPGLVFTPPEQPSEADDGLLTASEVAALRLDADWVILSACNTAAGDGSEGSPGLSGLARAFFYAGARNLLASHWPVRDDVSARLTVRTIELQREQPALSRAEAFQRAMREIREDSSHDGADDTWAHPNAWAPFTLIGDGAR